MMVDVMMVDLGLGDVANSPFIVPVAGCLMIVGIVGFQAWGGVRRREMESQERLAAIAKGVALPSTRAEAQMLQGRPLSNSQRRFANTRMGGIVVTAGAIGLIVFFMALTAILHVREILCGAAAGLIPLGIGVALLVDASKQKRELEEASAEGEPGLRRTA